MDGHTGGKSATPAVRLARNLCRLVGYLGQRSATAEQDQVLSGHPFNPSHPRSTEHHGTAAVANITDLPGRPNAPVLRFPPCTPVVDERWSGTVPPPPPPAVLLMANRPAHPGQMPPQVRSHTSSCHLFGSPMCPLCTHGRASFSGRTSPQREIFSSPAVVAPHPTSLDLRDPPGVYLLRCTWACRANAQTALACCDAPGPC